MRTGYFDRAYGNYLPCEPDERPIAECAFCGQELYRGDEVYLYDGCNYCSDECFLDDLGVRKAELEEEY